jgi:hypothetical protein
VLDSPSMCSFNSSFFDAAGALAGLGSLALLLRR